MFKPVRIAIVVAALGFACADASAQMRVGGGGVEVGAPNNTAVVADASTSIVRDTRRTGGHTLRCWQHGRLLYEGSGFRGPLERGPTSINVPRRSGEGDAVTVMNLNDAFCMLTDG